MLGFLLSLRASGKSPKTELKYRESVELLDRFVKEMGMPPIEKLTAEHLRHYFMACFDKGNKASTVDTRYRSLQAFYKWLIEEGERTDNPLTRIKAPRVEQVIQPHYTPEDINRVLLACDTSVVGLRDKAIILTLFDTGLRASELCSLQVGDLNLKAMTLHVRKGKGKKERIVGIGYKPSQAIERYLRKRADYMYLEASPWLFANWYGEELTENALTLMLGKRFRASGATFRGAHAFRRGFAIAYLDSGGSPEDLRVLAGWDSPQMLRRYTKATEGERALRGHRLHSPADALQRVSRRR
jgi:site-specific recombinase XerD